MNLGGPCHCVSTHRPADHESRQVYAAVVAPWGKEMQQEQAPRGTHKHNSHTDVHARKFLVKGELIEFFITAY